MIFSGTIGSIGALTIDNLSIVVPQKWALPSFIFSLYVNLIPPDIINLDISKALESIFVTPSADIVVNLSTLRKDSTPIDVTDIGKVIEVIS